MRVLFTSAALLAVILAVVVSTSGAPAVAQTPTATPTPTGVAYTTILIPRETLDTPLQQPGALADALGRITATVDEAVCASIALTGPSDRNTAGDKIFYVGVPGQPIACAREGADIVFFDGDGHELFVRLKVQAGSAQALSNLALTPSGATPTRGFLAGSISIEGQGPLLGTGRVLGPAGADPTVLIIPVTSVQPISVREAISHTAPIEPSGAISRALPVGSYLIAVNHVGWEIRDATESIVVDANTRLTFPAKRIHIRPGETVRIDLNVTAESYASPRATPMPFITEPHAGGGQEPPAIRVPDTGDAGLKRSRR